MLGLHPRTLQRRLREEGECFESLKDSVRRDVALQYLIQPDVPLSRVAELLGYSEASVLSRSCARWFSATPKQLRNELSWSSAQRPAVEREQLERLDVNVRSARRTLPLRRPPRCFRFE